MSLRKQTNQETSTKELDDDDDDDDDDQTKGLCFL